MTTILKRKQSTERVTDIREQILKGSKTVKFSMNMPTDLHRDFRKKAFLEDRDMKDILLEAVRKYMNT